MNRTEKVELIGELSREWAEVRTAFLLSFRGLNVPQVTQFRHQVKAAKGRYRVVKNTLAARAMQETPLKALIPDLSGPTGIVTTGDDPVVLAKALVEFSKENPSLVLKSGLVEGQRIGSAEVARVATMPGRQELLARLVGLLGSPVRRLVVALHATLAGLVTTLDQIKQQKEKE